MFISNLKYMGLGMLCILIVMGIIILLTMLLEKVSVKKRIRKSNSSDKIKWITFAKRICFLPRR